MVFSVAVCGLLRTAGQKTPSPPITNLAEHHGQAGVMRYLLPRLPQTKRRQTVRRRRQLNHPAAHLRRQRQRAGQTAVEWE